TGLFQYEAPICKPDPKPPAPVCQCLNSTYPDDRCCTTDGTCKPETLGGAAPTIVSGGFSCLDPAYPNPMCAPGLFDVPNYYTYQCPTCNPVATNCVPPTTSTTMTSTTTAAITTAVAVATTTTTTTEATTTAPTKTTTTAAQPEATTSADYPDMTITFSESAATSETTTAGATTKEQGSSTTPMQTTTLSESTTEPPATTSAGETTTQEVTTTTAGTTSAAETTTTAGETTSSAADTTTAALTTTEEPTTTTQLPTTSTTTFSGQCCGTWSSWTYTTTCAAGGCLEDECRSSKREFRQLRYVSNANENEAVSKYKHLSVQPPVNPADTCAASTAPATPPAFCCGTWSAWTVTVGCPSGSCGACQSRTKTRTCLTSGACPCKGPTTITEPCSTTPCAYPKDSCCGSYKATSVGTAIVCAGDNAGRQYVSSVCTIKVLSHWRHLVRMGPATQLHRHLWSVRYRSPPPHMLDVGWRMSLQGQRQNDGSMRLFAVHLPEELVRKRF
ncbi:Protein Y8A9A.2, partial [Aphelenchoides avenae]